MTSFVRFCVCLLLCVIAIGCTKPEEPMHPVAGRVLFDGKPVQKGEVVLAPDAEKGNTNLQFSIGKIDRDGRYVVQTFKKAGTKAGWYKVMVLAFENEPEENPAWIPIWIVPEKYTKYETTTLAFEVVADPALGSYDLVIER
ncbi:MAG: hypothetical protein EXS16_06405 [Gemmataceae bacterium]|nr:hypothetical protein [Gemmataceae bacterium]